jgi:hypothetical protein
MWDDWWLAMTIVFLSAVLIPVALVARMWGAAAAGLVVVAGGGILLARRWGHPESRPRAGSHD